MFDQQVLSTTECVNHAACNHLWTYPRKSVVRLCVCRFRLFKKLTQSSNQNIWNKKHLSMSWDYRNAFWDSIGWTNISCGLKSSHSQLESVTRGWMWSGLGKMYVWGMRLKRACCRHPVTVYLKDTSCVSACYSPFTANVISTLVPCYFFQTCCRIFTPGLLDSVFSYLPGCHWF